MQTLDQPNERTAEFYWLAFLLTGQRESGADAVIEAFAGDAPEFADAANPFFATWMQAWSRKVVISKALTAIRDELAESARQTQSKRAEKPALPPRNWSLDPGTSKIQLERALLAIDVFPRCVLLLATFEKASLDDAATLLNANRDLVRKAHAVGLRELTGNLARMQGWTSAAGSSFVITSEMQHA